MICQDRLGTNRRKLSRNISPFRVVSRRFACAQEWAWCEREMAAAAKALGFEGPDAWTDALAYVSADHAPPVWKTRLFFGSRFHSY